MAIVITYALAAQISSSQASGRISLASVVDACRADYQTYCKGVRPGGGRIKACLKQNASSLSAECKDSIKKAMLSKF